MAAAKLGKRKADAGAASLHRKSKKPEKAPLDESQDATLYDPMIDPTDSSASSDGDEDEDGPDEIEQPEAGPSRPSQKSLYAPPTIDEMDRLRSAQDTGNTFALQLEALVSATLLPTTPAPALKTLLSRIHDFILAMPSLPAVAPARAAERTPDIPFPAGEAWSPLKQDVKWTLGWEKPAEVFVGGSWSVCGGYKKGKGVMGDVDLVVVMPSTMFTPKDRLNYRYFHKRAHYLAVIKEALQAEMEGLVVEWRDVDARRPIIVLRAGKGQGLKHAVEIKIHASTADAYPPNTISPAKSLLRIGEEPSPLYATSIAKDTLQKAHLLHLHRLSQLLPNREVDSFMALWRIWARRRGLNSSGWFAGMLLGWIVDGGEIGGQGSVRERTKPSRGLGRGLGYWGALRAVWEFLAHTDFAKTPVFIGSGDEAVITPAEFCRVFTHVFVDPTRTINIFAVWEEGEVDLLRHHARETLAMLEDPADRFGEVFLSSFGPSVFDEFARVNIADSTYSPSAMAQAEQPDRAQLLAGAVASVLRRGLSDRARLVSVRPRSDQLEIGIMYNPQQATRVMDMGPSSDQPGDAFRALWGKKAELRRFKDGSIAESVVWEVSRPEEAALIPGWIVNWLLKRHFGTPARHITSPSWLSILQIPASARNAFAIAGSEKLGFSPIMKAYDELYRLLKSIDPELPLAILNVTPSDEMLRYSSTFVPHPVDLDRFPSAPDCIKYTPAAEIVVQFESSAKWPDDLAAVQKVKLALLEKLAGIINAQLKARAEVVFDSDYSEIQDHVALEVLLSGVAFTLRIHYEKERTMLERILKDDTPVFGTSLPLPPRRLAVPALNAYTRRFVDRPQHHAALAPMHHRYPSYSSATRLLKRWFAAHMLSLQVPSEAIELIMAGVYLDPGPLSVPASATTGFLRAIERLASWDWRKDPFFVPIYTASREAESGRVRFPARTEAMTLFEQLRSKDSEISHGAWVLPTEEDLVGMRWTRDGPSKVIASRVGVLAKATADLARQEAMSVKSLFRTPLQQYDILIHLRPAFLPRYAQAVDPAVEEWEDKLKFRNLGDGGAFGKEVKVDFDPAWAFAQDIQRLYGDAVLVLFDRHGGTVIGLLINPAKNTPRALKPFLGYSTRPVQSESALVEINADAVLAEITRMGEGLIDRVERRLLS